MNKELIEALARCKAKYQFASIDDTKVHSCKIKECHCTHTECDRGWIEHEIDGITYVDACKQCRPVLRWGLREYGDDREELQDRLRSRALKLADKSADIRTLL